MPPGGRRPRRRPGGGAARAVRGGRPRGRGRLLGAAVDGHGRRRAAHHLAVRRLPGTQPSDFTRRASPAWRSSRGPRANAMVRTDCNASLSHCRSCCVHPACATIHCKHQHASPEELGWAPCAGAGVSIASHLDAPPRTAIELNELGSALGHRCGLSARARARAQGVPERAHAGQGGRAAGAAGRAAARRRRARGRRGRVRRRQAPGRERGHLHGVC